MRTRLAVLVAGVVAAAGCSFGDSFADNGTVPAAPAEDALVGVWVGFHSSARYELRADHTFTATSVPASQFGYEPAEQPTEAGPFHGDGTWSLQASANASVAPSGLQLFFERLGDAHDIPVAGRFGVHAVTSIETVSPDRQLILGLSDDYLTKRG
ncbi:hypothetical protein [Dactylosporangium sp. NPDC051541]|uniref:hypothetical protein n=1 Tax=Dactylosporangium sp. NPDC051541 TaxID=3363977 RepID=UPI00378A3F6C